MDLWDIGCETQTQMELAQTHVHRWTFILLVL